MTEEMKLNLAEAQANLATDFPPEAYSEDRSRGFALTSIKAAYITERLNDVFGLCGFGWRYAHTPVATWGGGNTDEIIVEVAIQYRLSEDLAAGFVPPIIWNNGPRQWEYAENQPSVWSAPVFAYGGKRTSGGGSAPATDAHKSAITDGLTKAASILGVGLSVFKGEHGVHATPAIVMERPMDPKTLKEHLNKAAAKGSSDPASDKHRGYVVGMMTKCIDGMDEEAGPDLLEFLWEERDGEPFRHSSQLSKAQASAMLNEWLLDGDNANILHSAAPAEARKAISVFRESK